MSKYFSEFRWIVNFLESFRNCFVDWIVADFEELVLSEF